VGDIPGIIEIDALLRDFDPASAVTGTEEAVAAGIGDAEAIDDDLVIVEAGLKSLTSVAGGVYARHYGPQRMEINTGAERVVFIGVLHRLSSAVPSGQS
jgi:hypothetical protein